MKTHYKLILGGIGALIPSMVMLCIMDAAQIFADPKPALIAGAAVKAAIAFIFGVLVILAYRKTVNDVGKILQLGMAAPGLFTMMVADLGQDHAGQKEPSNPISSVEPVNDTKTEGAFLLNFFPSAYAQDIPQDPQIIAQPTPPKQVELPTNFKAGNFQLPDETWTEQFLRGFQGSLPENRFYVVQSSQANELDAYQEKVKLESQGLKNVSIYNSSNTNLPYRIVLGEQLNYDEATKLSESLSNQAGVGNMLIEVGK
jgi:hypothetical protein